MKYYSKLAVTRISFQKAFLKTAYLLSIGFLRSSTNKANFCKMAVCFPVYDSLLIVLRSGISPPEKCTSPVFPYNAVIWEIDTNFISCLEFSNALFSVHFPIFARKCSTIFLNLMKH